MITSTGPTNRATWRLDPYETAIANSIRSFHASWTATRCSARLPIVGMTMTPTKKAESPNVSMNGSIAPTRISERTASSPAVARSTTTAVDRLQAGPPCSIAGSWPPRVFPACVKANTSDRP